MLVSCNESVETEELSDDKYIVYLNSFRDSDWGEWDIYSLNLSGIGFKRLTDIPGNDLIYPGCLSPDGNNLVFISQRNSDNYQIFIMDSDGRESRLLSAYPAANEISPSITPDGSKIVFSSNSDGYSDICIMNLDGSARVNLTNTCKNPDINPIISPNGRMILFTKLIKDSIRIKNEYLYQPYLMGIDGSNLTDIGQAEIFGEAQCFSPQGDYILFTGGLIGYRHSNIYKYDLHSREITQLTFYDYDAIPTDISPDGQKIVYHRSDDYDGNMMMVMENDGGNQVLLTYGLDSFGGYFTPGGNKIIYVTNIEGAYRVYKINLNGEHAERISHFQEQTDYNLTNCFKSLSN